LKMSSKRVLTQPPALAVSQIESPNGGFRPHWEHLAGNENFDN
jgi:hypothetical protein